ncbi:MAG: hypothetical protein ACKVZ0_15390 [Gemmatimonadales bacterium]
MRKFSTSTTGIAWAVVEAPTRNIKKRPSGGRDQLGVGQGSQVDPARPHPGGALEPVGDLQRQPRFPDSGWPGQADEAGLGEPIDDRANLAMAADEAVQRRRQCHSPPTPAGRIHRAGSQYIR